MATAKIGSRKITVNGVDYRWRVSRYRKASDWKADSGILSEEYLQYANQYGLGSVANVVFNVPIELFDEPQSKILLKYFGTCVDGFFGPEQLDVVKPSVIAKVIEESLSNGWNPDKKGDFEVQIYNNVDDQVKPLVLILPGKSKAGDQESVFKLFPGVEIEPKA